MVYIYMFSKSHQKILMSNENLESNECFYAEEK